ncbi:glycosyltransferase family 2 protein [Butyrivibrio sp. YAB3001]|uniref:glycosyltransferase family 2 protein n=1 Tax=Butyrivibrio sp. YAB3001 TaxID=1520812 RepID=UPI0008F65017|nr:glycosyltransferase [Butyrivibrio sp. YAB3001]SFC16987.1 Glycosyl transferase family 2 [Butyrivibrio sp. YAB3001]
MELSIIVPVFNMASDKKLEFCIESLLGLNLSDYEIIAVDDCSTDNSLDILRDYEKKYPQKLRVIHSEVNKHQGGAKNIGIKAARGEWISFIDADDWIDPDMFAEMLKKADETGADMVGCDLNLVDKHTYDVGDVIEKNGNPKQSGVLDHNKKKSLILDGGRLVAKIFKRDNIIRNNLFFPENIFYEDNAMMVSYLLTATHYEYISKPWYYYYQHGASTVHSFSVEKCNDRMEAGRIMVSEAKRLGFLDEFYKELEFTFTILFYVNTLFTYMPCVRPTKLSFVKKLTQEMKQVFPEFEKNNYYLEKVNPEEKKLVSMCCKSPLRFYVYYKLLWFYRGLRNKKK